MKYLLAILALSAGACVSAQGTSCESAATAKKLSGTARAAFIQKCDADADAKAKLVTASRDKKYFVAPTSSYGHCEQGAADL